MNIEEIISSWDIDCVIDDTHLDRSSIETSKLHAKYLRELIGSKIKMSALSNEYNNLRQVRFRYYRGELTQEELLKFNWIQWQGVKPIKSEMEEFLLGDEILNKLNLKLEYYKSTIELLEAIMNQLKARDWQIKNSIQWRMFINGN